MFHRVIGVGILGVAVAGMAAVTAAALGGAGLAVLACAAKRRAEARTAWPKEEDVPPAPAEEA